MTPALSVWKGWVSVVVQVRWSPLWALSGLYRCVPVDFTLVTATESWKKCILTWVLLSGRFVLCLHLYLCLLCNCSTKDDVSDINITKKKQNDKILKYWNFQNKHQQPAVAVSMSTKITLEVSNKTQRAEMPFSPVPSIDFGFGIQRFSLLGCPSHYYFFFECFSTCCQQWACMCVRCMD